jgi:uncharacterized FAD-dependent dehydrogenase
LQKKLSLKLSPAAAADGSQLKQYLAAQLGVRSELITGWHVLKRSIDARSHQVFIVLNLLVYANEPFFDLPTPSFYFKDVHHAEKSVIIIGAGPAGLFAALKLLEVGIKPIILERGKDVRSRRRDLAQLNKEGVVNPESNYCFGEGGAGTYSDGKLYTRSNKRGDIQRIINLFVHFGAPPHIAFESHPHIGTNKLPGIITAMREAILEHGGEIHFDTKVTGWEKGNDGLTAVITSKGHLFSADSFILATGHSARDIFESLHKNNILIEQKPFALGVRVEHPQVLIDKIQYHCDDRGEFLPPASYSLVQQVNQRGVFSFCMCPGGIIAPASTAPGELVVNGWSPSKRNNPFANSGMVVEVDKQAAYEWLNSSDLDPDHPLLFMYFQQKVERDAFDAGGGKMMAPAQRMADFCNGKFSHSLPENSYLPGLQSADLRQVLPGFVYETLKDGFLSFGKKMKGYYSNDAVVVATESRTSSPVRIPRDAELLHHPQWHNLYPCGEGAGYAGGIVSAAMDGERVADAIAARLAGQFCISSISNTLL